MARNGAPNGCNADDGAVQRHGHAEQVSLRRLVVPVVRLDKCAGLAVSDGLNLQGHEGQSTARKQKHKAFVLYLDNSCRLRKVSSMANINFSLADQEKESFEAAHAKAVKKVKKSDPQASLSFSAWLVGTIKKGLKT